MRRAEKWYGKLEGLQRFSVILSINLIYGPRIVDSCDLGKIGWCMMYDMFVHIRGNPTLYNEALVDQIRICSASTVLGPVLELIELMQCGYKVASDCFHKFCSSYS